MKPAPQSDLSPDLSPQPTALSIPAGFREVRFGGDFMAQVGPLYARWTGERVQLGFRVLPRHANPVQTCHGGMMATLVDMVMPMVALYQSDMPRHFLPTISLNIDYLAGAPVGSWVQGQGEVLRRTRNLVFLQCLIHADDQLAVRANGTFKLGQLFGDGKDTDPFRLRQNAG